MNPSALSVSTGPDSPRLRPAARVRIPQHVVHRDFPAQTVILNLKTGKYHGLNPTAGRMLAELERGRTIGAAAAAIAQRYGQSHALVERDMCELCERLLECGVVEVVDGQPATPPARP